MQSRIIFAISIAISIVGVALYVTLRETKNDGYIIPQQPKSSTLPKSPENKKELPADTNAKSPQIYASPSALREYLDRNQNSATAFSAAFDVTNDLGILREGLILWPESIVLLTKSMLCEDDLAVQTKCATDLRKLQPRMSLPIYFLAKQAYDSGNLLEATKLVSLGVSSDVPLSDTIAEITQRRVAWEASGSSPNEARINSLSAPSAVKSSQTLIRLLESVVAASNKEPNSDQKEMMALSGVALSEHLRMDKNRPFAQEMAALAQQSALLSSLNSEYEFGETGKTVGQQIQQVEQDQKRLIDLIKKSNAKVASMNESEFAAFCDKMLATGQIPTASWNE